MLEIITSADAWIAFITLTALELVLGIDNIIFITILVYKLPPDKRAMGRRLGLFLAMFMRIALLSMLAWLVGLTAPLFTVWAHRRIGTRPDPYRWRPVSPVEEHERDSRHVGRDMTSTAAKRVQKRSTLGSGASLRKLSSWTWFFPWIRSLRQSVWWIYCR